MSDTTIMELKCEGINGFRVSSVLWEGYLENKSGSKTMDTTDAFLLRNSDGDELLLSCSKHCCELGFFDTFDIFNLIGKTIDRIVLDPSREHNMIVRIDIDLSKTMVAYGEYENGCLDVTCVYGPRSCVTTNMYIIKTIDGPEVTLPLVTISNGYYTSYLKWELK